MRHDAIVVGAGPAGNLAALTLAKAGHRVAVVDWRETIGDKLCTGIIGTECVQRFPPQEGHVYQKARSATVVAPSGKRYDITKEEVQAYIVDRVSYVDSIAGQAVDSGAEYMLGLRVEGIDVSSHGVVVEANDSGGRQRLAGEVLILASGFSSPLLNMVGLNEGPQRDFMVGTQVEVEVGELDNTEVYLGESIAPGSFGWLVPLNDGRALAGLLSRQRLNGHLDGFVSRLRSSGKVRGLVERPRKWGIPVKPLRRTYGDRVLVAGDAAGFAKPTTGGGIYYALLSGKLAAETAIKAIADGDLSARKLKAYQREWKTLFGGEMDTGYYARKLFEALDDQQIERLVGKFLSPDVHKELVGSGDFSFDWQRRIILKAVRHHNMRPVFRSFGPILTPLLLRLGVARLV